MGSPAPVLGVLARGSSRPLEGWGRIGVGALVLVVALVAYGVARGAELADDREGEPSRMLRWWAVGGRLGALTFAAVGLVVLVGGVLELF